MSSFAKNAMFFVYGLLLVFAAQAAAVPSVFEQCHRINDWTLTNEDVDRSSRFFAVAALPLFMTYPNLVEKIPYLPLANLPTPVSRLEKLGDVLGHAHLYLKNDAGTNSSFGGNKPRKLAFLLSHAMYHKATHVVTCGGAGSNHSTATIVLCRALGLSCTSCLSSQRNTSYLQRNLLLSLAHGSVLSYHESSSERQKAVLSICARKFSEKQRPYYISAGGSNARGSLGFVNAAFELAAQVREGLMPEPDMIFVGAGSNGTAAGLALGLHLAGLKKTRVHAVLSSSGKPESYTEDCKTLFAGMFALLELEPKTDVPSPIYLSEYAGDGYAHVTEKTAAALKLLQEKEGLKLDGTYAGKALGAFIDFARNPECAGKNLLFWNTFCTGSFKEETSQVSWEELPQEFHQYFDGTLPLQTGDIGV